jgi:dTDP-4-amino-4,6-dideoxygalactose transaminase
MLNTSYSPWPSFSEQEITAVSEVLRSNKVNYWTGQEGKKFEKEFAQFCNSKYAIAVANGTLALDLALQILDIKSGDEVIVTSRTFIASISSIINAGATPVFADVELDSQNVSANTISSVLSKNTKAIMCVHLAGWPCEMDDIMSLAEQHDLYVIEDCAQAHGTKYRGRPVGSIGHVGAWSFCQDKIMTTGGEGGMLTTNDEKLWRKGWAYKDHGKSYATVYEKQHPAGFRWLHESFGTNWRLTEMQSAIGRIQLTRMSHWQKSRHDNAEKIRKTCQQYSWLIVPKVPEYVEHAFYKCYVHIVLNMLPENHSRETIIDEISQLGVPCYSGSCSEVYKEKAFEKTTFIPKKALKNAQLLGENSLMFLVHPTLTVYEISKICVFLNTVFKRIDALIKQKNK